jgi:hypothetical protein
MRRRIIIEQCTVWEDDNYLYIWSHGRERAKNEWYGYSLDPPKKTPNREEIKTPTNIRSFARIEVRMNCPIQKTE